MSTGTVPTLINAPRERFAAGWTGFLTIGLVIYSVATIVVTVLGVGTGPGFEFFTLFSDTPTSVGATFLAAMAARSAQDPSARRTWQLMAAALTVYSIGNLLNSIYWHFGRDPFPSIGDLFFLAFYPLVFAAILTVIRAGAVRVPWGRLALDSTILMLGFGAFFWFFVIRPSAAATGNPDIIKYVLIADLHRAELHDGAGVRRAAAECRFGSPRAPHTHAADDRLLDHVPCRHRLGHVKGERQLPAGRAL